MFSPSRAHHHSKSYRSNSPAASGGFNDTRSEIDSYDGDHSYQQEGNSYLNHRYRSPSPLQPRNKTVSISDFKQWLKKNKEWEAKHKQKVQTVKKSVNESLVKNSIPK
jgi:hypothetical protein